MSPIVVVAATAVVVVHVLVLLLWVFPRSMLSLSTRLLPPLVVALCWHGLRHGIVVSAAVVVDFTEALPLRVDRNTFICLPTGSVTPAKFNTIAASEGLHIIHIWGTALILRLTLNPIKTKKTLSPLPAPPPSPPLSNSLPSRLLRHPLLRPGAQKLIVTKKGFRV